jgi:hypothetical protein
VYSYICVHHTHTYLYLHTHVCTDDAIAAAVPAGQHPSATVRAQHENASDSRPTAPDDVHVWSNASSPSCTTGGEISCLVKFLCVMFMPCHIIAGRIHVGSDNALLFDQITYYYSVKLMLNIQEAMGARVRNFSNASETQYIQTRTYVHTYVYACRHRKSRCSNSSSIPNNTHSNLLRRLPPISSARLATSRA